MFSQRYQSREVQASVLPRKAIIMVAGGLGSSVCRASLPAPAAWSLSQKRELKTPRQLDLGLVRSMQHRNRGKE